jgi:hypothetical protein
MADNHIVAGTQGLEDPVINAKIEITKARNIRDDLLTQASVLAEKVALMKAEMRQIGFEVCSGRDQKSRARLTSITAEHFALTSDQSSLDAAIGEAKERLEAALEHERIELQKSKARDIVAHLEYLDNAATSCDMALKTFLKSYAELQRQCQTICAATGHPQSEIVRVLSLKALQTAFLPWSRVFDLGALAPGERVTFSDLASGWGRIASSWCAQRLGSLELPEPEVEAAE